MPNENYYKQTNSQPTPTLGMATDFVLKGLHYFTGFELRPLLALAIKDYLFTTGNTDVIIDSQSITARSGDFNFSIFEDSTTSADGTVITIQNSNRPLNGNPDFTPTVGFFEDPTVTSIGVPLINFPVLGNDGTGGKGKTTKSTAVFGKKFVLKKNTKYLMRIDNSIVDNLDADIGFQVDWHEHRKSVGGD
jgi:hypothetical protein